MAATSVFVLVTQVLSLLLLWLNIHLFRRQTQKCRALLKTLGNEAAWGNGGRFLLPAYAVLTIAATAVMIALFVFQPHLL